MRLRIRLLLALYRNQGPMSNDELRQAIGEPAMPQCTVTWNLRALVDVGAVSSNARHRYNRWALTGEGTEMAVRVAQGVSQGVEGIALDKLLPRPRTDLTAAETVSHARDFVPRTVFDLARTASLKGRLV